MTYQILKMVLAWSKSEADKGDFAYHKAMAELAVAVKRVMVFH